jgi:hypothetical protein
MRTAVTIGITKSGKAEVISHPTVAYHKQRTEFNSLPRGKNDKYVEIQFFPSKGRMLRRRFTEDTKGGVNYNAAHRVAEQALAKKKGGKKLPDLTPKQGANGGVNMAAGRRIDDQVAPAKKKSSAKKKSAKKTAGAHTAGAKVAGAPADSAGGSAEDSFPGDSGPTL